jgi:transcriptional regulator with XRE-family HTH domain
MILRFARNIWWLRTQRRLSQEALAFRAQIHRTQISLIEGEKRTPRLATIICLAGGLQVPVQRLFDGISFRPPLGGPGGYVVERFDLLSLRPRSHG